MERTDFLTELAQLLSRSTREEDVIGRENGGFGILLYKTGHEGSRVLEQRLSNLIQNHRPFQSERLQSIVENLQIQSFTYPEQWKVPEPFSRIASDLNQEIPFRFLKGRSQRERKIEEGEAKTELQKCRRDHFDWSKGTIRKFTFASIFHLLSSPLSSVHLVYTFPFGTSL